MQPDRFGTMERMIIGSARVSTDGQDELLQIDSLSKQRAASGSTSTEQPARSSTDRVG